jgi:DNA polymerase epsilon subunit 3
MSAAEPQDADLPKALLKRLIKGRLQEAERLRGGDASRDFQVNKDALLAFGEAGKLFVHYLTAAANDVCKEAKRQTVSADDVLAALADLEFDEFVEPLKEALEGEKMFDYGAGGGAQNGAGLLLREQRGQPVPAQNCS